MSRGKIVDPVIAGVRSRGLLQCYWSDTYQRYIVKAWPTSNGGHTQKRMAANAEFAKVTQMIKALDGATQKVAHAEARRIPFLPRDVMAKMIYGTYFLVMDETSQPIWSLRMAQNEIQQLLDSITQTVGSIIVRTPDGWMALDPGDKNQVLTMDDSGEGPIWADASGGSGGGGAIALQLGAGSDSTAYSTKGNYYHTYVPITLTDIYYQYPAVAGATYKARLFFLSSTGVITSLAYEGPSWVEPSAVDVFRRVSLSTPLLVPADQRFITAISITSEGDGYALPQYYNTNQPEGWVNNNNVTRGHSALANPDVGDSIAVSTYTYAHSFKYSLSGTEP